MPLDISRSWFVRPPTERPIWKYCILTQVKTTKPYFWYLIFFTHHLSYWGLLTGSHCTEVFHSYYSSLIKKFSMQKIMKKFYSFSETRNNVFVDCLLLILTRCMCRVSATQMEMTTLCSYFSLTTESTSWTKTKVTSNSSRTFLYLTPL